MRFDTPMARLRSVLMAEGISYLLLLFVAMPLKYLADYPQAVRIAGSLHGLLFVLLALCTWLAMHSLRKPLSFGLRIAIASLIPFASFALDAELAREDAAHRSQG